MDDPITAEAFIKRVVEVSNVTGMMAGVGAMELAGQIVSGLAANPEHLQRFMDEGSELLIDGTLSPENGCLTFWAMNGNLNTPANLRKQKGHQQ